MRYKSPGQHKDVTSFRSHLSNIDPDFVCDDVLLGIDGPLGMPFPLDGVADGQRVVGNRFAIHPMEGWDAEPDGRPTELTLRRWHRFGRSGAKLIWGGEAFAVQEDGRANPNQLFRNEETDLHGSLSTLRAQILGGHRDIGFGTDDLFVGLQLTHSGRFSRPHGTAAPRIAFHHPILDDKFAVSHDTAILSDGALEEIRDNYVRSATFAAAAGFDFVDIKCCHGYLLHELLGATTRDGQYGGSFENRTRLFREIIQGVRHECPDLAIGVRVSIADVFPFSKNEQTEVGEPINWQQHVPFRQGFGIDEQDPRTFDLAEPFQFLRLVEALGIRLVNISLGSPYYCPHLQRPAAYPPSDGYLPPHDPLRDVWRHINTVRQCKQAFPALVLVGTGYSYLQEYLAHVAQYEVGQGHVDFVGLGRMVLSYPELPLDVLRQKTQPRKLICRTFSDCTTAPRHGLRSGCYPLDPLYKKSPDADRLKQIKKAQGA